MLLPNHFETKNKLLAPCDCKGTIKYIHKNCLKQWAKRTQQYIVRCSICQQIYASRDQKRNFYQILIKLLKVILKKREVIMRDISFFTLAFLLLFGTFYYLYKYQQVEKDSQAFNIVLTFFVSRITTLEIIRALRKRFSKVRYYLNNIIHKKVYINKDELYDCESMEQRNDYDEISNLNGALLPNSVKPQPGKRIDLDPEKETFQDFKDKCSEQLGITSKRIFNVQGMQINMLPDLINNEIYYVTEGEQYVTHAPQSIQVKQQIMSKQVNQTLLDKTNLIRIAILGESKSGKTSIVCQYLFQKFNPDHLPTIEDIYSHRSMFQDEEYELSILDTAGCEEYKNAINDVKIKERDAYVIVIDLANENALTGINDYYRKIYNFHAQREVTIILVGNQTEKERSIDFRSAEKFAQDRRSPYIECCAASGENVEEVFNLIMLEVKKQTARRIEIFNHYQSDKACCGESCSIF
ncbi:small gtpase [Stylonychia lemnae]|uniref:Small gtpase n=1 Tax=Stylonychia lemnae TaxID=5949 RepID=A0A078A9J1_STYLE|nr:small gtpase [Stylonychia lemnae]|eukprot:CDW78930.1 small gtpase [Stylonychia lemnae]